MAEQDLILNIENLVVHYETSDGVVQAVNGIDMKLGYNRTIGLVGETGAGKTTTALSILRLIDSPPGVIKSGKITLDGRDLLSLSKKEMEKVRGDVVSMIFQDPMTSLNPVYTVGAQIAEVIKIHTAVSEKEAMKKAKEMLEMVGIPGERANDYPHQFSGDVYKRQLLY